MEHGTQNATIEQQQELLVRVDRNNRMVQRLSEKLNSYTYEPKCPQRFEKYYELNQSIQNYKTHQNQLMSKIRERTLNTSESHQNEVNKLLKLFKQLESDFASYLFDLKKPL